MTESVLLITVDCLRADHTGCYGYSRPTTPNIDQFASSATRFEYGFSNCPGTQWALQSIHTGLYTSQIEGIGLPSEESELSTLATEFKKLGYETGAFVNNGFLTEDFNYHQSFDTFRGVEFFSRDEKIARAGKALKNLIGDNDLFSKLLDKLYMRVQNLRTLNQSQYRPATTDRDVCDLAIEWIQKREARDTPFFVWIHLMDAHTPYGRWNEHLNAVRGDTAVEHVIDPGRSGAIKVGDTPPDPVIDTYDANIRSADNQVGRLLRSVSDSTIVAVTGDHGEEFGRFKAFHMPSVYSSMTQVPIILRTPKLPAGMPISKPAQHIDITPTLLDAAGGNVPDYWMGNVLDNGSVDGDRPIFFDLPGEKAIRINKKKLIEIDGDVTACDAPYGQPETETNRLGAKETRKLLRQLRDFQSQLNGHPGQGTHQSLEAAKNLINNSARDNLEELGYLE